MNAKAKTTASSNHLPRSGGILKHTVQVQTLQGITKQKYTIFTTEDRIRIIPVGDIHIGAPQGQCQLKKVAALLEHIEKTPNTYMLGTGDYMDCAQKMPGKKGPSVYFQSMPPQQQLEKIQMMLLRLAQKHKILGLHGGNHEGWILELTGIDVIKILADNLKVPYLGPACDTTVDLVNRAGQKQRYLIYSQHGNSNAKQKHTKMGALIAATKDIFAHIFIWGHVHQVGSERGGKRFNGNQIKCYYVLAGHWLDWEGSYAQLFGLDICPAGTAKIQLFADRNDVHVVV